MRHFIHDRLYARHSYFDQVRILQPRIPFTELNDQTAYQAALQQVYAQTPGQAWHTPSELFSPHYGQAIARWITAIWNLKPPLRVYEIGPGNGTLAYDVITELLSMGIEDLEYHGVELNPQLAAMQQKRLSAYMPRYYHLHQGSMLDWRKREEGQAIVLAMEVLDNLPHDLIRFDEHGNLEQASVAEGRLQWSVPKDPLTVQLVETLDLLGWKWQSVKSPLRTMLNHLLSPHPDPDCEWIPTVAYQMLQVISKCFTRPCLLMSDFTKLPQTIGLGYGAPLVQGRKDGELAVYDSILLADGNQDIMFPTNFEQIEKLWAMLNLPRPLESNIHAHPSFFEMFADHKGVETKSGWNPLLHDFVNVEVFSSH